VKDSESNSFRRDLAAFTPIGDHPDPDIITAFAEGSLLEHERLAVMAHLADCAECRAILSFAAGDEAEPPRPGLKAIPILRTAHKPFRRWITWGSMAAGIAIACTVALRYEWSRNGAHTTTHKPHPTLRAPQEVARLEAPMPPPETLQKKSATRAPAKEKQAAVPE